jgi:CRISPR-associated protein Cmr4
MQGKVGFLYAVSQIHAGKGSDVGVVDLPIQRERHTDFPVISGVKGAIRNEFKFGTDEEEIFGSEHSKEGGAGNVAFSEAKILLFPVRSVERGFVWLTSRLSLTRLKTAFAMIENNELVNKLNFVNKLDTDKNYSTFDSGKVGLEEYEIETTHSDELKDFMSEISTVAPDEFLSNKLVNNVIMLKDEDFKFFLNNSTEILPRIVIKKETGTSDNLWYEEYLPQDTIMYFVLKELRDKNVLPKLENKIKKRQIKTRSILLAAYAYLYVNYQLKSGNNYSLYLSKRLNYSENYIKSLTKELFKESYLIKNVDGVPGGVISTKTIKIINSQKFQQIL